ncbi:MAG: nuclear transport factor 2 family protein [Burkholderiales bacterium]
MIATVYATSQDAEAAFYKAFEHADLAQMMAVWAEEDDILCVHPGGDRHAGVVEVRESWRQIFAQGSRLQFRIAESRIIAGRIMSIHSVYEHVTVTGEAGPVGVVMATNIYLLTNRGWRMQVHHGSPLAMQPRSRETPPSVLH